MQKKREIKSAGVAWGELRSLGVVVMFSVLMLPSDCCLKRGIKLRVKILAFTQLRARVKQLCASMCMIIRD